ncbi:hypothetical protein EMGBS15_06740 [Filimonas sp.]|nr:hypothetical protein EMGBS15_06740 [Filimonas sp.]
MANPEQLTSFLTNLSQSLQENTFVKLTLGNYQGAEPELKNIYVKKVMIRDEEKLSLTSRFRTRDIVKNYFFDEGKDLLLSYLSDGFRTANLFTTAFDLQLEYLSDEKVRLRQLKASHKVLPDAAHDRNKKRHLEANTSGYLHDLQITSAEGLVLKNAQDKYKQINHYIELLSTMLHHLPKGQGIEVADMGSGKGYLTFALYDYLKNKLQLPVKVTGVEYRQDMVTLCNEVAKKNQFDYLAFVQGSIEDYECKGINMLIALHACDTATDDALFKGIQANADLIVVAPCCHKQIRNQMEQGKKRNDLDFILRHGIFLEREAVMVTDSLRALLLEYSGYRTRVFEFISEANTPKNVMIVAERQPVKSLAEADLILQKIRDAKSYFGIQQHHLEMRLGL